MGVRPPSNGADESPDVIEFGIAALDAQVSNADVSFPASKSDLRTALGGSKIAYNASGNAIAVNDLLEQLQQEHFESEQELLNAAHPVFERKRERASTNVLAQLRQLVPF
jgi:hypothetical protein